MNDCLAPGESQELINRRGAEARRKLKTENCELRQSPSKPYKSCNNISCIYLSLCKHRKP
uniref:Uncharacterized protein n=1 Tax=Kuenenia stuttgartiensis TaxID=174633 RepID=Q1Q582_KUEST|nr:unknown protein [Candidatus Kuenenia stuttgartiensis]